MLKTLIFTFCSVQTKVSALMISNLLQFLFTNNIFQKQNKNINWVILSSVHENVSCLVCDFENFKSVCHIVQLFKLSFPNVCVILTIHQGKVTMTKRRNLKGLQADEAEQTIQTANVPKGLAPF